MEERLDSRKLRYFVEAIEQGSFNRAAGNLRVSQPALSKAIRILELDLGVSLLERTREGVRPTSYGNALYSYAKAFLADLKHARLQIESLKRKEQRQIVIGTLYQYSGPIIASALARLQSERGTIPPVKIVERPELELIAELRRGDFDFVLGLVRGGEHAEGLRERPLLFVQHKAIVRAQHPLTRVKKVSVTDLAQYPWILPPPGTIHRPSIEQAFRDANLAPPVSLIEGGSLQFHLQLLLSSNYVVALSPHAVAQSLKLRQLTALPISLPGLHRTIGIITRALHQIPPAANQLIGEMERVSRELAQ